MNRIILITMLMSIIFAVFGLGEHAYIINGTAETLSRIDLNSGEVNNHIVTLGAVPNHLIYYQNKLFVVNSGTASLMIIDPASMQVEHEVFMPINSNPWNVCADGGNVYVTGFVSDEVYKINFESGQLVDTWSTGESPSGLIVFQGKLYVANTAFNHIDYSYGQGSVSIIDIQTGIQEELIDVSTNPQGLLIGGDGTLNVICTGNYYDQYGMVYFIDRMSNTVEDSLAIGGTPNLGVTNGAGVAFVSAGGWWDFGHVYSFNTVNRTILHGENDPYLVGLGSMQVALDSDGMLYSVGQMANAVTKFSEAGTIIETYTVGAGPVSIATDSEVTGIEDIPVIPTEMQILVAYPNPFNASVTLSISNSGNIDHDRQIAIYDVLGRQIAEIGLRPYGGESLKGSWGGTDWSGQAVKSGIYFAKVQGTDLLATMVLIK